MHMWEAKPPEAVCLCLAHHPFHLSKANTNRQILEKSVKLLANMHWPVWTTQEKKSVSRVGSASVPAVSGPEIRPDTKQTVLG